MYTIDEDKNIITTKDGTLNIYSKEAFNLIKKLWIKSGWANKYSYQFTWLGRPIIQLPEDMIKAQEIIFSVKPTLIIETGIAHGGSLIFYASLLKMLGKGKVVGVDIEIKDNNKNAILSHDLAEYIQLIEGSSISYDVINKVKACINNNDKVLVFLDSNHTCEHVLSELKCYSEMVTVGSYIVATDGVMEDLVGVPGGKEDWLWNNPQEAVRVFLKDRHDFILEDIKQVFNESQVDSLPTYWPNAWLKKIK